MAQESSHSIQVLLSLIVAAVIVAVTIAIVTLNLGEGLDPDEIELRQERREEQVDERQERIEEQQDEGEETQR